jgi:hypothetical protein
MKSCLIALLLTATLSSGCATKRPMDGAIRVSPDTLECMALEIERHQVPECTKGVVKALEPFIK